MSDEVVKNSRRGQPKSSMDTRPQYQQLNIEPIPATPNLPPATKKMPAVNTVEQKPTTPPYIVNTALPEEYFAIPSAVDTNKMVNLPDLDTFSAKNLPQSPAKEENINVEINEYLLLVQGKITATGNMDHVEQEIEKIIYGDVLVENLDIQEDIVVLKRIPIKIGVHIKE